MIFIITGTEAYPFDRFIKEIDRLKKENWIKDDVHIQLGSCNYIPENCTWDKWLPFDVMCENIRKADMVIAHAGAGTTLLCLELGKKPVIVTRQKKYNEHLDDHQVPFARMMEKLGYAFVAYEVDEIRKYINKKPDSKDSIRISKKDNIRLVNYLNTWLAK